MNDRLLPLFLSSGMDSLKNSAVAVVGVGGVGGECAVCLARSGVGKIIIQDFDTITESNKNRQIVASDSTVGLYKVDVLEKMLKDINKDIEVVKLKSYFDINNQDIFNYKFDYLIDCIDSIDSKCQLIQECLNRNILFISSMGAAKKIDPTKIVLTTIKKTSYDKLAKKIRLRFRDYDFPVVSSNENPVTNTMASYMPVVATFGLFLADYVIKKITKIDERK